MLFYKTEELPSLWLLALWKAGRLSFCILSGSTGKRWCCHTSSSFIWHKDAMQKSRFGLQKGRQCLKTNALYTGVNGGVPWRQSIEQYTTSTERDLSNGSAAKGKQVSKMWTTGIRPYIRCHWGVCRISVYSEEQILENHLT